jgi:hypothetical protein
MSDSSQHRQPLDMTVYSLPDPLALSSPASGRGKLLAVVLACSLPFILAYFVFFVIKPSGQASFGELIHPARAVVAASVNQVMLDEQGHVSEQPFALENIKGQWLIVSVGSGACDDACMQRLFVQRQLREMIGKDRDRVDRVWLIIDDTPLSPDTVALLKDLTVLRVSPDVVAQWFGNADLSQDAQELFIVDPMGNAMLHMPAPVDGKQAHAALHVLQKLLAASAVWDLPGR